MPGFITCLFGNESLRSFIGVKFILGGLGINTSLALRQGPEGGHGCSEVGFAVSWGEGEVVGVGLAARVGVGAFLLGDAVVLFAPGDQDRVRDDAAVGVEDVAGLVVAVEDRELGAVDGAQLIGRDAEHRGHQRVNLDQGIAAVDVPAQRRRRSPPRADITHTGSTLIPRRQQPLICREHRIPDLLPHIGIGIREAIQPQSPQKKPRQQRMVQGWDCLSTNDIHGDCAFW